MKLQPCEGPDLATDSCRIVGLKSRGVHRVHQVRPSRESGPVSGLWLRCIAAPHIISTTSVLAAVDFDEGPEWQTTSASSWKQRHPRSDRIQGPSSCKGLRSARTNGWQKCRNLETLCKRSSGINAEQVSQIRSCRA